MQKVSLLSKKLLWSERINFVFLLKLHAITEVHMGEVLLSSVHWHIPQNTKKELRSTGHWNYSYMQSGCLKNRLSRHFDGRHIAAVNPPFIPAPLYRGVLVSLLEPSLAPLEQQSTRGTSPLHEAGSKWQLWKGHLSQRYRRRACFCSSLMVAGRGMKGWEGVGLLGSESRIEKTVGYVVINMPLLRKHWTRKQDSLERIQGGTRNTWPHVQQPQPTCISSLFTFLHFQNPVLTSKLWVYRASTALTAWCTSGPILPFQPRSTWGPHSWPPVSPHPEQNSKFVIHSFLPYYHAWGWGINRGGCLVSYVPASSQSCKPFSQDPSHISGDQKAAEDVTDDFWRFSAGRTGSWCNEEWCENMAKLSEGFCCP